MIVDNIDEIEINLLALVMRNGNIISEASKRLKPFMFSSRVHEFIFSAMLSLQSKGREPSKILIKNELITQGHLEGAGGDAYLNEVLLTHPQLEEFNAYLDIIEDAYKRRELYRISNRIQKAVDNHYPTQDIITQITTHTNTLINIDNRADVIHIADASNMLIESLESRRDSPGITGISTGFAEIDSYTMGYNAGDVWMIGARPSIGKTALLVKTGLNAALIDVPFLLVNREMTVLPLIERVYSVLTGISFSNIRMGKLTDTEFKRIKDARDLVKSKPFYIDNTWSGDEHTLYNTIRKYYNKSGIRIVGIDYIQLLAERDENSTSTIGRISRNLKLLSGELGLTTIVLSQLRRDVEFRPDKRPLSSDLRQSGNLEEDADIMAALYRDEVYTVNSPLAGIMEFIIRKQRNGPIGACNLRFDGDTVNVTDFMEAKSINWDEQDENEGKPLGKRGRGKAKSKIPEGVEA